METPIALKDKCFLCWDSEWTDSFENMQIVMHEPQKRELALVCDKPWEGPDNSYASVIPYDNRLRMYYRCGGDKLIADGRFTKLAPLWVAMAESTDDGKTFSHPSLGLHNANGTSENNIIHAEEIDNFSVFLDENPECPPEKKFKALSSSKDPVDRRDILVLYVSPDGLHFSPEKVLPLDGTYDSFNVIFWDRDIGAYRIYYRGYHTKEGKSVVFPEADTSLDIRDIRLAISKDLETFERLGPLDFGEHTPDIGLYTNNIFRYERGYQTFLGFPCQYVERYDDASNFAEMPLWNLRRSLVEKHDRTGYAETQVLLMTSHDGFRFQRSEEPFIFPETESSRSWWYGDQYPVYGPIITPTGDDGEPEEISMYFNEGYHVGQTDFRRYSLRLDGFLSWYADRDGGCAVTKPFTFEGDTMEVNFRTAATGNLCLTFLDEAGHPIDGFASGNRFGNSTQRQVVFSKPLSELQGKTVRLKIEMRSCHLYSFRFHSVGCQI